MAQIEGPQGGRLELISFEIGGQTFCVDVRAVREIRGWTPTTPMPQAPSYVLGLINLRGVVMPVVDLRNRLGLGVTEPTSRHVIIVVQHDSGLAGLVVDAVQETFKVEASALQRPPSIEVIAEARFVDAIIPLEGCMVSRLVVAALLPAEALLAA